MTSYDSLREQRGFTLIELSVSTVLLMIVGLLMFMTISYATSASAVSGAKLEAQASVRDVLRAMTAEIQTAAKKDNTTITPTVSALQVVSATKIVFQVPTDTMGSTWSTPITYEFINEDKGGGAATGNGMLDSGEDANGDQALTRCVLRTQGTNKRVLGAANNISNVQFALNTAKDALSITVSASKVANGRRKNLVAASASTQVFMQN